MIKTRLYSLDETGFSGKERSKDKVLAPKRVGAAYQQMIGISRHVTFQVVISTSGKAVALLVILSKNLPNEWSFVIADIGYINGAIFLSWFHNSFVKQIGRS